MINRLTFVACLGIAVFATGPARAADLYICWIGGNGYTMNGTMSLPDDALNKPLVTEADLTGFVITGYHNGKRLGRWDMRDLSGTTTWHLRFDPRTMTFPTGDTFGGPRSQGWNANGSARDCGTPGFGFNSGDFAQDICVNGVYLSQSSIKPQTPLVAHPSPLGATCATAPALSKPGN